MFTVADRLLPFHVRWGGDEVLTTAPPTLVPLPPGGIAYVGINKNTCVRHYYRAAHMFQVIPPNDYQALSFTKPRYPSLSYCRASATQATPWTSARSSPPCAACSALADRRAAVIAS